MSFSISSEVTTDGAWVLRADGDIDISTAPQVREHLQQALSGQPPGPVICHLEGVTFLDSVGVSALVEASHEAEGRQRAFCLAAPRGHVRRVLDLVRLVEVLPCFATLTEALTAADSRLRGS